MTRPTEGECSTRRGGYGGPTPWTLVRASGSDWGGTPATAGLERGPDPAATGSDRYLTLWYRQLAGVFTGWKPVPHPSAGAGPGRYLGPRSRFGLGFGIQYSPHVQRCQRHQFNDMVTVLELKRGAL